MPEQFRVGPVPTVSVAMPHYYMPPLYHLLSAVLVGDIDREEFTAAVIPNPQLARRYRYSSMDNYSFVSK
jgi:hypothetical protein